MAVGNVHPTSPTGEIAVQANKMISRTPVRALDDHIAAAWMYGHQIRMWVPAVGSRIVHYALRLTIITRWIDGCN